MQNVLGIKAELCQTHATSIAANNGTHSKNFKDDEKYEKFYGMLCDLISITCDPAVNYLQCLLVQWLRDNVDDPCEHWFETHCSCGVGLVSNNQSLKATCGWDGHACTLGSQVISPKYYILSKIQRSLSKILRTLSKIMRTLSKILRTLSKILRTQSKILRIQPHTQVGLLLYLTCSRP